LAIYHDMMLGADFPPIRGIQTDLFPASRSGDTTTIDAGSLPVDQGSFLEFVEKHLMEFFLDSLWLPIVQVSATSTTTTDTQFSG
jgi:hypothetical protein